MLANELSLAMVAGAASIFFLAGAVKGISGVGLPMVAIPLLSLLVDPATAIAVVIGPAAATNVVQALRGGYLPELLRRFWSLCLPLAIVIGLTTPLIIGLNPSNLMIVVGGVVAIGALLQLVRPEVRIAARRERLLNPVVGSIGGLLSGGANLHGGAMSIYFIALGLERDKLVAAIGMVFVIGAFPIYATFFWFDLLPGDVLAASALALVPALMGQWLCTPLRRHIDERTFRKIIVVFFLIAGLNMVRRGLA